MAPLKHYSHSDVLPPSRFSLLILLILYPPTPLGLSTTARVLAADETSARPGQDALSEGAMGGEGTIDAVSPFEREPTVDESVLSTPRIRPAITAVSHRSESLIRPTARTSPSYTPLIPGMIAGGLGITLVPQGPWVPRVQFRETNSKEPYFEGASESNVTARLGSTAYLDCKIKMVQNLTVTWLHRKNDIVILLTVGLQLYSSDSRFSISYRNPNNWRLKILSVVQGDEGSFECQVATHPIKIKRIYFKVNKPELKIVDENGEEVMESYYQTGSKVKLTCLATYLDEYNETGEGAEKDEEEDRQQTRMTTCEPQTSNIPCPSRKGIASEILWRRGDSTISPETKAVMLWSKSSADGMNLSATLIFASIRVEDGGNYTCSLSGISSAAVLLHVVNGKSYAVQSSSSVFPVFKDVFWSFFCSVVLTLRMRFIL